MGGLLGGGGGGGGGGGSKGMLAPPPPLKLLGGSGPPPGPPWPPSSYAYEQEINPKAYRAEVLLILSLKTLTEYLNAVKCYKTNLSVTVLVKSIWENTSGALLHLASIVCNDCLSLVFCMSVLLFFFHALKIKIFKTDLTFTVQDKAVEMLLVWSWPKYTYFNFASSFNFVLRKLFFRLSFMLFNEL